MERPPRTKGPATCDCCGGGIDTPTYRLTAHAPHVQVEHWSLCEACFHLLVATIQVELEHGPGTPPPDAWTKVRRLRANRHRRWSKADP